MGSISSPIKSRGLTDNVQNSKKVPRERSLNDPKKFKPTKRQASFVLKTIFNNLSDVIIQNYLLVRKQVHGKTVKTYYFLIFKNHTNLIHACSLVHQIVPQIEINNFCSVPSCTCQTCSSKIEQGKKRRGFGYIHQSEISETINRLQRAGFIAEVKQLPQNKNKHVRHLANQIKCDECSFICRTKLGFSSHIKKHGK